MVKTNILHFLGSLYLAIIPNFAHADLIISEFLASNVDGLLDEEDDDVDWIEVQNTTNSPITPAGQYYLTDDIDRPDRWALPNVTIPANGSIIFFASNKADETPPSNLHTDFTLSSGGEYLALTKVMGGTTTFLSEFDEYPRQFSNISYGVVEDLTTLVYFETPSPGSSNGGTQLVDYVRDTSFSVNRGFYSTPQTVVLSTNTPEAQIIYTTDGSEPSTTNGTVYTGAIDITTTTTLRVIGIKADHVPTNIDTNTYIFLDDVIDQPENPAGWPNANTINGQEMDYEMDNPAAVRATEAEIKSALSAIPSISLVTDQGNLIDEDTGIYVNPENRGFEWERPTSVELIFPPGYISPDGLDEGFQEDGGLRIRGGFSRMKNNPKHAFRLFFRKQYGESTLRYRLFGNEGVDEFKGIDLRTAQNYSWSFKGQANGINSSTDSSTKNTFLREVAGRDTQRALGQPYTRSRYYHLYVNGLYWGLFMTQERAEADFAATYLPGNDSQFDTLKSSGRIGNYVTEVTDGTQDDWMLTYNLAADVHNAPSNDNTAYRTLLGLNAAGEPDPNLPVYIDPENLINYMLVVFYHQSFDSPFSHFVQASNNWFALRNRERDDRGWSFFAHDMEHSLGSFPRVDLQDRTGPFWNDRGTNWEGRKDDFTRTNPQFIHQHLLNNDEYRLKFSDVIQRTFFNDGPLTDNKVLARIAARKSIVDQVIDAEAARWGDAKSSRPLRRSNWERAVDILEAYVNGRNSDVLRYLIIDDLYPQASAGENLPPTLSQHGGVISPGFSLTITNPNGDANSNGDPDGTVFYTSDGTDPRRFGGANVGINGESPIVLNGPTTIKARIRRSTTDWSPLVEATFVTGETPDIGELVLSEINYHPTAPTTVEINAGATLVPPVIIDEDDDFEFIEIHNVSDRALDLSGVTLASAEINHRFGTVETDPANLVIAAGARIVVPRRNSAFGIRYPGIANMTDYSGKLSNNTDTVSLTLDDSTVIFSTTYMDDSGWPSGADGEGYSLVLNNPAASNSPTSWRISVDTGGNPTTSDSQPFTGNPLSDDNGNGIVNLIEAVLTDGSGNYSQPIALTVTEQDQMFLAMEFERAVALDNVSIFIEQSTDLAENDWSTDGIMLLSSEPQGNGIVKERYRFTTPANLDSAGFLRVRAVVNP